MIFLLEFNHHNKQVFHVWWFETLLYWGQSHCQHLFFLQSLWDDGLASWICKSHLLIKHIFLMLFISLYTHTHFFNASFTLYTNTFFQCFFYFIYKHIFWKLLLLYTQTHVFKAFITWYTNKLIITRFIHVIFNDMDFF